MCVQRGLIRCTGDSEVNTKPILLTKYASYFQEENYQASVIQLKSALTARGIQIKG